MNIIDRIMAKHPDMTSWQNAEEVITNIARLFAGRRIRPFYNYVEYGYAGGCTVKKCQYDLVFAAQILMSCGVKFAGDSTLYVPGGDSSKVSTCDYYKLARANHAAAEFFYNLADSVRGV